VKTARTGINVSRAIAGRMLLVSGALMAALAGCAAMKASQQPEKKNLTVLESGTPRSHVIAELGAPLWSEQRDGKTVDIFAFKQGYSKTTKAGRALVHGTADVFTFGLWEVVGIPAETLADGKDVKVQVVYDANEHVQSLNMIKGQEVLTPTDWLGRKGKPVISTVQHSEAVTANVVK